MGICELDRGVEVVKVVEAWGLHPCVRPRVCW